MKIKDILLKNEESLSFEFFPPKTEKQDKMLRETILHLKELHPSFVSITYGAMGSTQEKTFDLTVFIKKELQIETMAHLTCIGATKEKIQEVLNFLENAGVKNILALRGDFPDDCDKSLAINDFSYASDLVKFVREKNQIFSVGVAGYPEAHIEADCLCTDIDYLKQKVDQGADFIITQLFFLNDSFFRFVDAIRKKGVNIPVIAGIMPLTNAKQLEIFQSKCGVKIPEKMKDFVDVYKENPTVLKDFGIEYSTLQCQNLIEKGFKRFHFYTLNRSLSTYQVCKNLGLGSFHVK